MSTATQESDSSAQKFEAGVVALIPLLKLHARRFHKTHHEIEDLVQETLCRALICRAQFNEHRSLKGWLCTIMRNCFIDAYRIKRHYTEVPDTHPGAAGISPPAQDWWIQKQSVLVAIQRLPPQHSDALLHIASGDSYEQTAHILKTQVNTVKTRVARARTELNSMYVDMFKDNEPGWRLTYTTSAQ